MRPTMDSGALAEELSTALGSRVTARHDPRGPVDLGSWTATSEGPGMIPGHGCGPDRESAVLIALMESLERTSQFGNRTAPVVTVDSAAALGPAAMHVPDLGLYSPEQYRRWPTDLAPFDARAPVAWVEGTRLGDGGTVLVPIEAVHPRAPTPRARLVLETSSGTAAGTDPDEALASALCEAVERDAGLRWWHFRLPTAGLDLSGLGLGSTQERLAAAGFVLVARVLPSPTLLPVVMLVALRGHELAIGSACAPDLAHAARHAMRELAARLIWVQDYPDRRTLHLPLAMVRSGPDHVSLYDRGPLHSELRRALDETTSDAMVRGTPAGSPDPPVGPGAAVRALLDTDVTPVVVDLPLPIATEELFVRRVLVPGLIPFWVGADRERLWHRHVGRGQPPDRVRTLLPHPFG